MLDSSIYKSMTTGLSVANISLGPQFNSYLEASEFVDNHKFKDSIEKIIGDYIQEGYKVTRSISIIEIRTHDNDYLKCEYNTCFTIEW
jgi:hypothetical protein